VIAQSKVGEFRLARELPLYMRDRRKQFRFDLRDASGNSRFGAGIIFR